MIVEVSHEIKGGRYVQPLKGLATFNVATRQSKQKLWLSGYSTMAYNAVQSDFIQPKVRMEFQPHLLQQLLW